MLGDERAQLGLSPCRHRPPHRRRPLRSEGRGGRRRRARRPRPPPTAAARVGAAAARVLSATLQPQCAAQLSLDAALFTSDFRPVELQENFVCNGALWRPGDGDKAGTLVRADVPLSRLGGAKGGVDGHGGGAAALCAECIADGGNVLVFCPTIKDARDVAARLAALFGDAGAGGAAARLPFPSREVSDDRARMLDDLRELHPKGEVSADLGRGVPLGVGVHHGKMTDEEKEVVEAAYRRKAISVLVCTSTLAAGVNLPARRVLILKPAACTGGNSGWLADKYRQMTGRAGRANLSAVGESFLLLDSSNKKLDEKQAVERDILSKAASPSPARRPVHAARREPPSLPPRRDRVARGRAARSQASAARSPTRRRPTAASPRPTSRSSCDGSSTRSSSRGAPPAAASAAAAAAADAAESLAPTELGEAVYLSALSPDEALEVHAELLAYQRCAFLETDIHLVYVLTPGSTAPEGSGSKRSGSRSPMEATAPTSGSSSGTRHGTRRRPRRRSASQSSSA